MSRIVAQFDPSAGGGEFSASAVNRCTALLMMNESVNFLTLDFGGAFPSIILQPWSNRLVRLTQPVQTVYWTVAATLQSADAPVSQVYVEAFDPSEDLSGIISGPLLRQTNVGNPYVGIASSLVNDSSPSGTQIIEARPATAAGPYFTVTNDGTITMRGSLTIAYKTGLLPASVQLSDNGNDLALVIGGLAGAGAYGGYAFSAVYNGNAVTPFGIAQSPGVSPLSWIDGTGVLHAAAPVTLAAGNQETGLCGYAFNPTAVTFWAVPVNFKTNMSSTPTSMTLTNTTKTNVTVVTVEGTTQYGTFFVVENTAAGFCKWEGTYTTVGNCLLAVDANAGTFDHHCEACRAVVRAMPIARLTVVQTSPDSEQTVFYTCPCGTQEIFTSSLTAADEADTTPQGSGEYATTRGAQATLIRQLMTALGLEVAA